MSSYSGALGVGMFCFMLVLVIAMTFPGKGSDYKVPTVSGHETAYTQPLST